MCIGSFADSKVTDVLVTAMKFDIMLVLDVIIFKKIITLLTFELNIFCLTLITFTTTGSQMWPIFFCKICFIALLCSPSLSASISIPSLTVIVNPNDPELRKKEWFDFSPIFGHLPSQLHCFDALCSYAFSLWPILCKYIHIYHT